MSSDATPVFGKASFKCPHCGAIAHQSWYKLGAVQHDKDSPPFIPDEAYVRLVTVDSNLEPEQKHKFLTWTIKYQIGEVFLEPCEYNHYRTLVENLRLSMCFSCDKPSVWVHNQIVFPDYRLGILPSADMPDEIKKDFIEAARILESSPRGSAALLRLCIQKLCVHLGERGKNINEDIAALVAKGLDVRIQKSLDIVRVVGNNAVHPGQIELTDDNGIASHLFRLVNIIVETMITQPKHINELYGSLPEAARLQIEKRDVTKARE